MTDAKRAGGLHHCSRATLFPAICFAVSSVSTSLRDGLIVSHVRHTC